MTPSSRDTVDIPALVKELQEARAHIATHVEADGRPTTLELARTWNNRLVEHFDAIAAYLLDQEERLRIAVEAMEDHLENECTHTIINPMCPIESSLARLRTSSPSA